jgi:hypothetical protein
MSLDLLRMSLYPSRIPQYLPVCVGHLSSASPCLCSRYLLDLRMSPLIRPFLGQKNLRSKMSSQTSPVSLLHLPCRVSPGSLRIFLGCPCISSGSLIPHLPVSFLDILYPSQTPRYHMDLPVLLLNFPVSFLDLLVSPLVSPQLGYLPKSLWIQLNPPGSPCVCHRSLLSLSRIPRYLRLVLSTVEYLLDTFLISLDVP